MSGAVMNYDFGPKRHWRRWAWNRIDESVVGDRRDKLVLYLAGADDFDRAEALRRGFVANNLVAVERDAASLASLRGQGVLAVEGEFAEVAHHLAKTRRCDVLFGDFCNGLTPDLVHNVQRWCGEPNLRDAVFAFNLLRGRDSKSAEMRGACSGIADPGKRKHRGYMLFMWTVMALAIGLARAEGKEEDDPSIVENGMLLHRRMKWAIGSYRSASGQYFDSVVFTSPMRGMPAADAADKAWWDAARPALQKDGVSAARSVAAVMAHRTRRAAK